MPKVNRSVRIELTKDNIAVIQHGLSVAAHHYQECRMFDGQAVRPAERLAQIEKYDQVFSRLLDVEIGAGWRKALPKFKEKK